jgi:chromosomal replication initiator protein
MTIENIIDSFSDTEQLEAHSSSESDFSSVVNVNSLEEISSKGTKVPASSDFLTVNEIWNACTEQLKKQLDAHVFSAYIQPLVVVSAQSSIDEFTLNAPSSFLRSYVDRYLRDHIERELSLVITPDPQLLRKTKLNLLVGLEEKKDSSSPYVVVKKITPHKAPENSSKPFLSSQAQEEAAKPLSVGLNPRYTFSNFVVGNSNQFCHAAALRVAETPGMSYNPLFVYGGVGLGKTHLLHAIGNYYLERNPRGRVAYMSSETFTNELILALRHAKMEEFKNRMRHIEVLLIDDIQFMRGKERTQEEFFHTFNALYNAKHQIVITCDKIPSEIPGLEERLQTRFSWGLTADLQAPDFETRVAILNRKAALDQIELPSDVANLIAENISSNVRELEGALTRLHAMSSLKKSPLDLALAEAALKPLLQPRSVNFSIADIKKIVAIHFGIKVSEMVSKRRTKNLSFPRHVAMYLCRKHTTASYPEIGSEFGDRDHSSVIHAANVVATKIKKDLELAKTVEGIEKRLGTQA